MNMDSDKSSVAAMSRIVKEKDSQIEELAEQLKTYADDLDNNAAIIEDLRAEIQKCTYFFFVTVQCCPFIRLYLGSMRMDHVISEWYSKMIIL